MKQTILFFKSLLRKNIQNLIIFAILFSIIFVFIPLVNIIPMMEQNNTEEYYYDIENLLIAIFSSGILSIFAAIIIAIMQFKYIIKKSQIDFYHSLPIRRENIFFSKYLLGFLTYIIPYLVAYITGIIVVNAQGFLTGNINFFIENMVTSIVLFLIIYTIISIVIAVTGSMATGLILILATTLAPIAILGIINILNILFLEEFDIIYKISDEFYKILIGETSILTIVAIASYPVLLFIAYYLFKIRKSEKTGLGMAFKWAEIFVKILINTVVGLYIFAISYLINESLLVGIINLIVILFITSSCLDSIIKMKFRLCKDLKIIAISFIVCICIIMGYKYDILKISGENINVKNINSISLNIDNTKIKIKDKQDINKILEIYSNDEQMDLTNRQKTNYFTISDFIINSYITFDVRKFDFNKYIKVRGEENVLKAKQILSDILSKDEYLKQLLIFKDDIYNYKISIDDHKFLNNEKDELISAIREDILQNGYFYTGKSDIIRINLDEKEVVDKIYKEGIIKTIDYDTNYSLFILSNYKKTMNVIEKYTDKKFKTLGKIYDINDVKVKIGYREVDEADEYNMKEVYKELSKEDVKLVLNEYKMGTYQNEIYIYDVSIYIIKDKEKIIVELSPNTLIKLYSKYKDKD